MNFYLRKHKNKVRENDKEKIKRYVRFDFYVKQSLLLGIHSLRINTQPTLTLFAMFFVRYILYKKSCKVMANIVL